MHKVLLLSGLTQAFYVTKFKEPVQRSQGTTGKEKRVLERSELFCTPRPGSLTLPAWKQEEGLRGSVFTGQDTFNLLNVNLAVPYHPQ